MSSYTKITLDNYTQFVSVMLTFNRILHDDEVLEHIKEIYNNNKPLFDTEKLYLIVNKDGHLKAKFIEPATLKNLSFKDIESILCK